MGKHHQRQQRLVLSLPGRCSGSGHLQDRGGQSIRIRLHRGGVLLRRNGPGLGSHQVQQRLQGAVRFQLLLRCSTYTNSHEDPDAYQDTNQDTHTNQNTYQNTYTNQHTNEDPYAYQYADEDAYADGHNPADEYANSHAYANHAHSHAYQHAYGHAYQHTHTHHYPYPHAHFNPHARFHTRFHAQPHASSTDRITWSACNHNQYQLHASAIAYSLADAAGGAAQRRN